MLLKGVNHFFRKKFHELILLFCLFYLPLCHSISFNTAFEAPKQFIVAALAVLLTGFNLLTGHKWKFPNHRIFFGILALFGLSVMSRVWAAAPMLCNSKLLLLGSQILLGFNLYQFLNPRLQKKAEIVLLSSMTCLAIYAVFQLFNQDLFAVRRSLGDWRDFIMASMGNTDYVAGSLCLFFPYLVYRFLDNKKINIPLLIITGIWASALLICWSVSAVISILCAFGCLAACKPYLLKKWKQITLLLVVSAAVIVFFNLPADPNPLKPGIFKKAFASQRWHLGGPTRFIIWENARDIFYDHLFLGTGSNNFIYHFTAYTPDFVKENPQYAGYRGRFTNAVHNDIMQSFCELGIAGGLLFLLLLFWAIKQNLQKKHIFRLCFFLLFILNMQMSFPHQLTFQSTLFILFLFFSISDKAYQKKGGNYNKYIMATVLLLAVLLGYTWSKELPARHLYKLVRDEVYLDEQRGYNPTPYFDNMYLSTWPLRLQGKEAEAAERRKNLPQYPKLGSHTRQLELLTKIDSLMPGYSDALSRLAHMSLLSGDFERAKDVYGRLLQYLNIYDTHLRYVYVCIETEDYDRAIEGLRRMSRRDLSRQESQQIQMLYGYIKRKQKE